MLNQIHNHNKINELKFHEDNHTYTISGGIVLTSVTTKLKKYFPFDLEAIAKKVADIRKVPKEQIISEWQETAKFGTNIHNLAEKYSKGELLTDDEKSKIRHAIQFFSENSHLEILGTEVAIFSSKYKIAGTVDLIVRNKENNQIYLLDYKTCNKDINKNEVFQMAIGPLKDFPNNKYYNYSMQVSIYSQILKEEYGIDIYDSLLIHLKPNMTYEIIPTEDMGMFVSDVLSD